MSITTKFRSIQTKLHIALVSLSLLGGCTADSDSIDDLDGEAGLDDELRAVTTLTKNIGEYVIKQPGTYRIKGKVTGNINVELKKKGKIIIEGTGTNPVLQGIPRKGQKRHVSHIKGSIPQGSSVVVRDFELQNNGHNGLEFGGPGKKTIENVTFINYTRKINGKEVFGAGCINAGENSEILGADLQTGDDAIKITEPNSEAHDVEVTMHKNGSAIQLGWGGRADGPNHIATGVTVKGNIKTNGNHDNPNTDNNSGRSIIGGVIEKNTSNVQITGLTVHGKDYARVIKLVANGAVLKDVVIKGKLLNGLSLKKDSKGRTWYPIVLVAKNGGKMQNVTIDLGKEAAKKKYHFIQGNVDVKFVGG